MLSLGMDIGTSTVKLVLLKNQEIEKQWMAVHHGNPFVCLKKGLSTLELAMDTPFSLCVTGSNTEALLEQDSAIPSLGDIPAIVEGVRQTVLQVGSVIEIGSQGARFITDLQSRAPQFAVNEHCAGGTGSFFEDQMSRVGCKLEDYSSLVEQAQSVPRLSGRCAVFAKTDIIHRQQEGVSTPDILLGLCYAMIRNYKATIVRRLPICKPVVFCGGVTCNAGVIRAIRDVFGLSEKELIVPEFARYEAALGAALKASGSFTLRQLNDYLDRTRTTHHMVGTLPKLELRSGTSLAEPNATKIIPESGCALGIDIGSTSTDLVLVGADGELVDFQYLRTAGDPEGAVRKGLASIRQRFGDIRFTAVGVTGSGRERIGKRIGADAVRDEITAQAKGAAHWVPEVDTVFEIGGQDSKYISMPHYYKITQGHGQGAELVMDAEAAFMQGHFERAVLLLERARVRAASCGQENMALCCDFLALRLSLCGQAGEPFDFEARRAALLQRHDAVLLHLLESIEAYYYALLGRTDAVPEVFREHRLASVSYFALCRPMMEMIELQVWLAQGQAVKVLARCEELLAACQRFHYGLVALHVRVQMAAAYGLYGQPAEARAALEQALAEAAPDGFWMPLAENYRYLAPLLAQGGWGSAQPLVERAIALGQRYEARRAQLNGSADRPAIAAALTEKELALARLVAQRRTNKEIAETLHLSEGTVKQYINQLYAKLDIGGAVRNKRAQLAALFGTKY